MKFAIIPNLNKKDAIDYSAVCAKMLFECGAEISFLSSCEKYVYSVDYTYKDNISSLIKESDTVIALGGDGTLIKIARICAKYNKPVLGINFGNLGFVTGLEPSQGEMLNKLVTGEYTTDRRSLLALELDINGKTEKYNAVNDIVVSRGSCSRIIRLNVLLNGKKINSYSADGVIFCTPTGSTAYSLSAGGPVIDPKINCICMTPICPHSLFSRPVIFGSNSILNVEYENQNDSDIYITIDGQENICLQNVNRITVKMSDDHVDLIKLGNKDFYATLNDKLWKR